MVYDETGYFLISALKRSLGVTDELPEKLSDKQKLKLQKILKQFSNAIIDHMSGSARKANPLEYFTKQAAKIEKLADQISEEAFISIPIRLTPILERGSLALKPKSKKDKYGISLRQYYTRQRIALIQQVAGARLYPNNADLGHEFEYCIKEYLEKNLSNDLKVTLGGHIYDQEGNCSDQMDIIISIPDAVPFQPSNRAEGKAMCLIEHVIAAITIKTKIDKKGFHECWENIQSIPRYDKKDSDRPRLKEHPWPLCFAICETTNDLDYIHDEWQDLAGNETEHVHDFQMLFSLTEGFLYPNNVCWPLMAFGLREQYSVMQVDGFRAAIGLGWILLSIIGRTAVLAGKEVNHLTEIKNTMHRLSLKEGVPET